MINWNKFRKKKLFDNNSIENSWLLTGKKEIELNDIDYELMEEDEL